MILNEQEIVQRINELITDSELKKSAFAVEAGIDASNFNKKLSGKLKFTDSDIKRIIAYTNVNIEWLMFGKGSKYGLTNENESTENKKRNDVSLKKENTSSVKIRLKQAMEALELSPYSLATVCDGITKNMLQTLWNSETDTVTTNVLEPFCKHFTQINCNWLMRGEGSMFIINQSEVTSLSNNEDAKIKQLEARIAAMSRNREQQDKAYELILSMLDVVSKTYNFFEQK